MPSTIYRAVDADLSQGDIVDDVPSFRVRPPLEIVRRVTMRGGRDFLAPFPYPPVEGKTPDATGPGKTIVLEPFHVKEGEYVPVLARFTRAILLNYDCDLAHEDNHCLIALVRPITCVNEDDRQVIRENRNFNYFFLPADEEFGLVEGYADLRQVTCVDPALIDTLGTRRASLTATGVQALQAQMFRFLTRRDLAAPPPPPAS